MERKRTSKDRLTREIIGLIFGALALFIAISVFTHHPDDPSFNNAYTPDVVGNVCGVVGSYTSDALFTLFGLGAILIPVIFILLSIHYFMGEGLGGIGKKITGIIFIILSSMIILGVMLGSKRLFFDDTVIAGGLCGVFLSEFLVSFLNVVGTLLFAFLILILFTIVLFGVSLGDSISVFSRVLTAIFKRAEKISGSLSQEREPHHRATVREPIEEEEVEKEYITRRKAPRLVESPEIKKAGEARATIPVQKTEPLEKPGQYVLPPIDLLNKSDEKIEIDRESLFKRAALLEEKLKVYGVKGKVTEVRPGPIITMFEFEPGPGQRINKIAGLDDDIAMAISALSVRIAPIPGKSVIGFEIPNDTREIVRLRDVISSEQFRESKSKLTFALGKDIFGNPVITDLTRMPHLLVAGATGAGKSVCINTLIASIIYKASHADVRFLLIDPKMLELSLYQGIPHLLMPVVTNPKEAQAALRWAVEEMERRYRVMANAGVKNITGYNTKIEKESSKTPTPPQEIAHVERMPYIVVIIDELADLMMTSSREVEESITRLAHMARASGIHLIVATQRPSVNVLTGIIKANFPARISFQVSSRVDSRTILDGSGAEHLLGQGDMLFLPPTASKMLRVHGAYISEDEIMRIVDFVKSEAKPKYVEVDLSEKADTINRDDEEYDEKYDDAVAFVVENGKASISSIQRHFRIGYNRAARIMEKMEKEGIVGTTDGIKPRDVLVNKI